MRVRLAGWLLAAAAVAPLAAQTAPTDAVVVLRPARVFDGDAVHEGWAVRVRAGHIDAVGPADTVVSAGAQVRDLAGLTVIPGLFEGHSHVLLHPYDETSWNDQVLKESTGLRIARATEHLRKTLLAGFTTIRDLGTEGAGYADVELKQAASVRHGIEDVGLSLERSLKGAATGFKPAFNRDTAMLYARRFVSRRHAE